MRLPIRLAASRLHLHGAAVSVAAGTRAAGGGSTLLGGGKAAATARAVGSAPVCALVTRARADVASRQSDGPLRRGAPRAATVATPSAARGSAATSASAASRSGKPKALAHPSVEMALSGLETGQYDDTSAAIAALELADPRIYITMYPGEDVGTARQKFRKTINQQVQRRGVVLAERPTPASAAATEGAEQAEKKTSGEDAGRKSKWRLPGQDLSGKFMLNMKKRLGARTAKTVPGTKNEEMEAEMKSLENAEKRRSAAQVMPCCVAH